MYKYYKKGNYEVMEYQFDSIVEFLEYLDTAPINLNVWTHNNLASEIKTDYDFYQTNNFEEAKELIKYGWEKDFNKLVGLKIELERYIKKSLKKTEQFNDYVGYTPDVKSYLEGSPLSMMNKTNPKMKHIDIYYNASVLCNVDANQIYNRGAVTLNIIEILENLGFSVSLHLFTMTEYHSQIHYANFNLKKYGERINMQKLYFPLCHPAFLRRLVFKLMEETPDMKQGWPNGYGRTCNDYTIRKTLDLQGNDIVICQPSEMHVRGKNIIDDANAMFDYINKFNLQDAKLEHIEKNKTYSKRY